MRITVNINEEDQMNQLLSYLEEHNFEWENEEDSELSDAHKKVIDARLEAIANGASKLRPVEDFLAELDKK